MPFLRRLRDAMTPTKRSACTWDECARQLAPEEGVVDRWGNRYCSDEHAARDFELSVP